MKQLNAFTAVFTLLIAACTNEPNTVKKDSASNSIDTTVIGAKATPDKCADIVMQILTGSEEYKKLTEGLEEAIKKNGGTSFGINMEGSPNPETDSAMAYSKTYDFSIYESYPDRNTVIARFSFDKDKKQLYKYDVVEDTLLPISFNIQLLSNLETACR